MIKPTLCRQQNIVGEGVRPGLSLGFGNARRCRSVLADAVQTRGLGGGRRCCINSAALRLVPCEDLQAEGDGACRELLSQAETIEGAKH